jgi:hypothetical protein
MSKARGTDPRFCVSFPGRDRPRIAHCSIKPLIARSTPATIAAIARFVTGMSSSVKKYYRLSVCR